MKTDALLEPVFLKGVLRNASIELACEIKAIKASLPKLALSDYVLAEIAFAPDELPDGIYDVSFEGRTKRVRKTKHGFVAA